MTEPVYHQISSRREFQDAIRSGLARAAEAGAAEIVLVDPGFEPWPLNERGVIESLSAWAASRRRLLVFGHAFESMSRTQIRFAEWRRSWSHVVQFRSNDELEADSVPTLLFIADVLCVRLLDRDNFRGIVSAKPIDMVECRETIDALLQRSTEAFPVTTLGL